MTNLSKVISEIKKFDKSLYQFFNGANTFAITDLEKKLKYELPKDFKEFLLFSDGADILCNYFYGVEVHRSLIDLYSNYLSETQEVGNPIPDYLLPIIPDGFGNSYCLNLNSLSEDKEKCDIIFWQHDYIYNVNDRPDTIANSFYEFILIMIHDYLEDNNNGCKK